MGKESRVNEYLARRLLSRLWNGRMISRQNGALSRNVPHRAHSRPGLVPQRASSFLDLENPPLRSNLSNNLLTCRLTSSSPLPRRLLTKLRKPKMPAALALIHHKKIFEVSNVSCSQKKQHIVECPHR